MRVVIAESFSPSGQAVLAQRGIEIVSCVGAARPDLEEALASADGLIVRSETRVDRDLLAKAPNVRVVGRAGVGVDAIDVPAATEAGIVVVNTPAANTLAATEHTFALMLALQRRVVEANVSLRAGKWERAPYVGNELAGKTLGIVGLGRIGGAVAQRARAFDMQLIAHDPFVSEARAGVLHVDLLPLDDVLRRCDILTLHVPLTPQTRLMIDAARLSLMKPSALLVNCARGGVVDEEALIAALDAGSLRGAAIDVVAEEPPAPGSAGARLQRHAKVLATPHLGGSTHEALERIAVELARDVADVLIGRPAAGAVNAPVATGAQAERARPYADAADRLGRLLPQLFGERNGSLRLVLRGEAAAFDDAPLRAAFLAAFLRSISDRRVSIVNADAIARELGISLEVARDETPGAYASTIAVHAGAHRVAATVLHAGVRIVEIDSYELDAVPQGAWVVTQHEDVPGMVGRVGTIVGSAGINIATMQVAREPDGGDALMVLAVDRPLEPVHLELLRAIRGMRRVDTVLF